MFDSVAFGSQSDTTQQKNSSHCVSWPSFVMAVGWISLCQLAVEGMTLLVNSNIIQSFDDPSAVTLHSYLNLNI